MMAIAGVALCHFVYGGEVHMDLSVDYGGRQELHCEVLNFLQRFLKSFFELF